MTRVALFGSSYVRYLGQYCNGDLRIPHSEVRFFGFGGMKAGSINQRLKHEMLQFQPEVVFICLGGNDISTTSSPLAIVKNIRRFVNELIAAGVRRVLVSEVLDRGNFDKSPGLTKTVFDAQRKKVNQMLKFKLRRNVVNFPEIQYPDHYSDDDVHLDERGLFKQYHRVKRAIMSVI